MTPVPYADHRSPVATRAGRAGGSRRIDPIRSLLTPMCGFAGVLTTARHASGGLEPTVRRMIAQIVHRGPDDAGIWVDENAGIALGFRRLAVVDLSQHGHQPMHSASKRFTVVFNGEIYNHLELRRELESNTRFRGHSDTEVMLAAFERWGIEAAIKRFVGMFALAVWDSWNQTLTFARDRMGEKPLYIYWRPGQLAFGSELKALLAYPDFDRTLNPRGLAAYLQYLYVPAPDSIFQHVIKLPPAHTLTVRSAAERLPAPTPYWSVLEAAEHGLRNPFEGSDEDAVDELETLLSRAVRLCLEADVPVGALLSGGVDSSTVVALAQTAAGRPLRTYAIGFDADEFNEAPAAARVAEHLGTDHTELVVSGDEALQLVPALPEMFDEPLANPSQIPTYFVSALARRSVVVALTGDGGDELFSGYQRYIRGGAMIERMLRVPPLLRQTAGAILGMPPAKWWDRWFRVAGSVAPRLASYQRPGERMAKIAALLRHDSPAAMYRSLLSAWQAPEQFLIQPNGGPSAPELALEQPFSGPLVERMMLADQLTYLPDDLLAKVDRASMAVSLEVRVPLLDHRIVEFAWRLPRRLRIRNGQGKWILRQLLYRRVPRELVERPKMGFTVPIARWLRGPLREWAQDLLHSNGDGFDHLLDLAAVRRAWGAFEAGRTELGAGLWAILVFRAWHERWVAQPSAALV